ncbi:hypothetical protein [Haladaptatus sp. DYF46]|uniref:hypothetical protein n=1 Tax=Haladaptatus sp. DYF46 TaxID=2886041 RepID=UPI001E3801BE|nr:hypothetical protein [Haladaptatus sp. DYF46]
MGNFDPVSWDVVEAATGPPAPEVDEYVETMREEVHGEDPYVAVKSIHDELSETVSEERTVPGLGEVFITAYLLEKRGLITPRDDDAEGAYRSIVDRRPSGEWLREQFWERERTLWWIGMQAGVHASLVTYWLYEDKIPLMERNFTEESMERIRAYRESGGT